MTAKCRDIFAADVKLCVELRCVTSKISFLPRRFDAWSAGVVKDSGFLTLEPTRR